MTLDLRQLECFVAVAEEGHVGRAAIRLHMTQPPLTRRIQRLEADVGARLFVRTPQGVELTAPGQVLFEQAERILDLGQRALEVTRAAEAGEVGELIVGYFGSTVFDTVPRLLADFGATRPDVRFRIERIVKNDQVEAVRDGRVHVGFGRAYDPAPDLVVRRVTTEPLFVASSARFDVPAHPTVADLAGLPLVLFPRARPSFADQVLQMCAASGIAPVVAHEAEDAVAALAYVGAEQAVAVVPRSSTHVAMPGVEYRPMAGAPELELSCLYRRDAHPPVLTSFLHHLDSFVG